jgi:beta-lactamase regulating signal transducer with metallopeptidase domain
MNTLISLFDWMLGAGLRASLLVLAVLAVRWLFKNRLPSRWRYALWSPVLVALLVPALPLLPSWMNWAAAKDGPLEATVTRVASRAEPLNVAAMPPNPNERTLIPAMAASTAPVVAPAAQPLTWREWLAPAWLCGAAGAGLFVVASFAWSLRRIRRGARAVDGDLLARIAQTAIAVGLRRAPRVLRSTAVASPAVCGLVRPTLLLNADFPAALTADEADMVLRHELTHIRRGDLAMNALLCALLAVHWWNPLLWLAFVRVRADREAACDADVLRDASAPRRAAYGHTLLKMETTCARSGLCLGFVGILQRGGPLRERIHSIITQPKLSLFMKANIALIITVIGILGLAKAAEPQSEDRKLIHEAVEKFARESKPRTPDHIFSHNIFTSKGRLGIATAEAKMNRDGHFYTEGKSRPTGYFLVPRAAWAKDAEEAERMLLEDYEKGNVMPIDLKPTKPAKELDDALPKTIQSLPELRAKLKSESEMIGQRGDNMSLRRSADVITEGLLPPLIELEAAHRKISQEEASKLVRRDMEAVGRDVEAKYPEGGTMEFLDRANAVAGHVTRRISWLVHQLMAEQKDFDWLDWRERWETAGKQGEAGNSAQPTKKIPQAARVTGSEDVAFFEKAYGKKTAGMKPIGEYDDPDTYYSEIAKQLGIPKIAFDAAAKQFGWVDGDGMKSKVVVKRIPGQWQVMVMRFKLNPNTGKTDAKSIELKYMNLDDDGKVTFPQQPAPEASPATSPKQESKPKQQQVGVDQSVSVSDPKKEGAVKPASGGTTETAKETHVFKCSACGLIYQKCSSCGRGPAAHSKVNHPPVHDGCKGDGKGGLGRGMIVPLEEGVSPGPGETPHQTTTVAPAPGATVAGAGIEVDGKHVGGYTMIMQDEPRIALVLGLTGRPIDFHKDFASLINSQSAASGTIKGKINLVSTIGDERQVMGTTTELRLIKQNENWYVDAASLMLALEKKQEASPKAGKEIEVFN